MKPYYQDEYATIYNCSSEGVDTAPVIVLDPPCKINMADYYGKVMFLFSGGGAMIEYIKQLPNRETRFIACFGICDDSSQFIIRQDYVLVFGDLQLPFAAVKYSLPSETSRSHKWERPIDFLIELLKDTKGLILDPFMGSGATLVAGKTLRRKCIGYDIEERYCHIAAKRLENIK